MSGRKIQHGVSGGHRLTLPSNNEMHGRVERPTQTGDATTTVEAFWYDDADPEIVLTTSVGDSSITLNMSPARARSLAGDLREAALRADQGTIEDDKDDA